MMSSSAKLPVPLLGNLTPVSRATSLVTLTLVAAILLSPEVTSPSRGQTASGSAGSSSSNQKSVTFGVLLPMDNSYLWSLPKVRFAIEYALNGIKRRGMLPGWDIKADYRDSKCSETEGPLEAMDMYTSKAVQVFLGPACDYAVAPVARFASRWEKPVITAGALVSAFVNKHEYRLLTRLTGPYAKAAEFMVEIGKMFGWRNIGIIYENNAAASESRSNCYFIGEALHLAFKNYAGTNPWSTPFDQKELQGPEAYHKILQETRLNVRIVLLCASADSVREMMIQAHELNFDNGEYVFFNIDLFASKEMNERPWYRHNDTNERNEKAKKAYEALMTVTLRKPVSQEYKVFSNSVKEMAERMSKDKIFPYGEEEVNNFVGAFHDAVILYALALNETLEAGVSINNGTEITRRMWNRTFSGITGTVSIDANGDRNGDYSLLDMDPATSKFHVVANYYGNRKLYEPVVGRSIAWSGGRDEPPNDTPVCGYNGSKCGPGPESTMDTAECGYDGSECPDPDEPFPTYGIVIIVLGFVIVIVLVAAVFVYRKCNKRSPPAADVQSFEPLRT